jgi:adenylate cyclase, class 2
LYLTDIPPEPQMLEIELKFRLEDWPSVQAKLTQLGGRLQTTQDEADHYFNAPDRQFRDTDEVLRIRCVNECAILTYKGPKRPGTVKMREEIEVPLANGRKNIDDALRLFASLRYQPVAVVRKTRTMYAIQRDGYELHICRDSVQSIGEFVEVEIVAPESEVAKAETVVKSIAAELGLKTPESRAYLRMVLEKEGNE